MVLAVMGGFIAGAIVLRQDRERVLALSPTDTVAVSPTTVAVVVPAHAPTTPYKPPTTTTLRSTGASGATPPTRPSTATTAPRTGTTAALQRWTVVIDPGHQGHGNNDLEPIGPGASERKPKVSSGTAGVATGTPESAFTLDVGLKLQRILQARGVKVLMTRTGQDVDLSNIQRAQIANRAKADLFVRLHADGAADRGVHGIHTLYPAAVAGWTDDIATPSKRAAALVQQAVVAASGATDRGLDARSDMTGFNWADVPAVLPELGFMSNAEEDRRLASDRVPAEAGPGARRRHHAVSPGRLRAACYHLTLARPPGPQRRARPNGPRAVWPPRLV